MSAPAQPDPVRRNTPKGTKLARKLSALSPPLAQATSTQMLTPQSAAVSAFPTDTRECFSDGDMDTALNTPSVTADQLHHRRQPRVSRPPPFAAAAEAESDPGSIDASPRRRRPSRLKLASAEAAPIAPANAIEQPVRAGSEDAQLAGDRKRRGSLWRAKLSFTNMRRPETRRQRHQSFDSNAVDIAAHPRLFSESPLVSLPTAAPATAHPRSSATSGQLLADALLEAGIDIAGPHSAAPGSTAFSGFDAADDASGLGAIDRDFLLTIQRNSALEARRQRRRETRRSTMSFLASPDVQRVAPAFVPAVPAHSHVSNKHANPISTDTACSESHAGEQGSTPTQDFRQPASQLDSARSAAGFRTAVPPPAATGDCSSPAAAGAARSPKKQRPTSLDSLTFSDAQALGSSRSARSSVDELLPNASASPQRVALSELGQAALKNSISQAAQASSSSAPSPSRLPLLATRPGAAHKPPLLNVASPLLAASVGSDSSVPPVPPLPVHITSQVHKQQSRELPRLINLGRPGTARPHDSPRMDADNRKYRGSTSAVPSALHQTNKAPSSLNMALLMSASTGPAADSGQIANDWDAQTNRLQRYHMAPTSAGVDSGTGTSGTSKLGLPETSPMVVPELAHDYSLAHSGFARKFSHPEAQMQSSLASPPVSSPDVLSKSATNLHVRMSIDSRAAPKDGSTSISHSKNGLGRLFLPSPPGRKMSPVSFGDATQPTSPTVSSLVGDPSARRKIRDQLASSKAFDRLLEEDDEFTMAISLTPTVAGSK
ncbi:hypothetical protein IWW50_003024 [Coemansia erecta]|nr:hypothetical protein IWW50_003024 [Coemansia erecta]